MSGDDTGHDRGPDEEGWHATGEPTTGSTPTVEAPVPHSRLVGFMAEPLARKLPLRRSTVLMLVAFLGFGALTWIYPPDGAAPSGTSTTSGGVPGIFVPTPTTTTRPVTTTTLPATTSTTGAPGTTSTTSTTTTTSGPTGSSTTTTSTAGRTTTTTTTTVGGAAGSTTTTTAP